MMVAEVVMGATGENFHTNLFSMWPFFNNKNKTAKLHKPQSTTTELTEQCVGPLWVNRNVWDAELMRGTAGIYIQLSRASQHCIILAGLGGIEYIQVLDLLGDSISTGSAEKLSPSQTALVQSQYGSAAQKAAILSTTSSAFF